MQLGVVHRDVRAPNFTCNATKTQYFLLDLELCGAPGPPCFRCHHWDEHLTLVDGQYTFQSDLYDFGAMVKGWAWRVRTRQGEEYLQLLQTPAHRQDKSAKQLLDAAQPWFSELGL